MAAAGAYWGRPTSTIDWCEANYAVTPYIAEFFNSTSSFFIVFAGLLPVLLHRQFWHKLEWRFLLVFLSIIIVGLGSVAFHGTLQFRHQMLDEVPMLWTVVIILYVLLEHYTLEPQWGRGLPIALATYAAVATYMTSQQKGTVQWYSFHTMFALCEFTALFLVWRFFRSIDGAKEQNLKLLMSRGFGLYLVAVLLWLVDLNFCEYLRIIPVYDFWNLHAFGWHLLTSGGLHDMMLGIWYWRLKSVLKVKVGLMCGALPRLVSEEEAFKAAMQKVADAKSKPKSDKKRSKQDTPGGKLATVKED